MQLLGTAAGLLYVIVYVLICGVVQLEKTVVPVTGQCSSGTQVCGGAPPAKLDPMVLPTVKTETKTSTTQYTVTTRECPAGYEGHYVDINKGFDAEYQSASGELGGVLYFSDGAEAPKYTVCFEKKFMDKVRANPAMQATRPAPPHPVE